MNRIISISFVTALGWALALPSPVHAQAGANVAVQRLADGSGYVSVVRLAHQADAK